VHRPADELWQQGHAPPSHSSGASAYRTDPLHDDGIVMVPDEMVAHTESSVEGRSSQATRQQQVWSVKHGG